MSQTQARLAKPNTGHGGLLQSPGPPLLGERMAPSCAKLGLRAAQRSRVSQLGKQRRRRQDCSPIFPQKQAEGVDQEPRGSDLLFPNQRYFENVAAFVFSPWPSPVAHH